jgi:hypothetical protein
MRVCGINPRSFGISCRERFFILDRIPCCGGICFMIFFGIWDWAVTAKADLEVVKLRAPGWRILSLGRHRICVMVWTQGTVRGIEAIARVGQDILAGDSLGWTRLSAMVAIQSCQWNLRCRNLELLIWLAATAFRAHAESRDIFSNS